MTSNKIDICTSSVGGLVHEIEVVMTSSCSMFSRCIDLDNALKPPALTLVHSQELAGDWFRLLGIGSDFWGLVPTSRNIHICTRPSLIDLVHELELAGA